MKSGDQIHGVQKSVLLKLAAVRSWPVYRLFGMCPPTMVQSLVVRGLVSTDTPIDVDHCRRDRKGVPRDRQNYARITDEGRAVLGVLIPSPPSNGDAGGEKHG